MTLTAAERRAKNAQVDWKAAMKDLTRHLKVVQHAIRGWTFSHPNWYVADMIVDYPPRIWVRCFLRARGKTRRTTTGVSIGRMDEPNVVQALTPTNDELREIGDFAASLETGEFTVKRLRDSDHPWVCYEVRPRYERYEVNG